MGVMPDPQFVRRTERLIAVPDHRARAASLLRTGGLVAFGTETVYGLGADATNAGAVARIFEVKGRPRFNPLIVHLPDEDAAFREVEASGLARRLARAFWPGPLTIVLPRRGTSRVVELATAGLSTLGVRVPAPPETRELLEAVGAPVAAPSANRSGKVSPSAAAHVLAELDGHIDAVLDGGDCTVGIESTVVTVFGDDIVLLRPGGVTMEELEAAGLPTRSLAPVEKGERALAPGALGSHYAPDLPIRLDATAVQAEEALLAFGPPLPGAGMTWNLSPDGDLREAAARLFTGLRELDEQGGRAGLRRLAVMSIPDRGLGTAIRDRLARAAAPRPLTGATA